MARGLQKTQASLKENNHRHTRDDRISEKDQTLEQPRGRLGSKSKLNLAKHQHFRQAQPRHKYEAMTDSTQLQQAQASSLPVRIPCNGSGNQCQQRIPPLQHDREGPSGGPTMPICGRELGGQREGHLQQHFEISNEGDRPPPNTNSLSGPQELDLNVTAQQPSRIARSNPNEPLPGLSEVRAGKSASMPNQQPTSSAALQIRAQPDAAMLTGNRDQPYKPAFFGDESQANQMQRSRAATGCLVLDEGPLADDGIDEWPEDEPEPKRMRGMPTASGMRATDAVLPAVAGASVCPALSGRQHGYDMGVERPGTQQQWYERAQALPQGHAGEFQDFRSQRCDGGRQSMGQQAQAGPGISSRHMPREPLNRPPATEHKYPEVLTAFKRSLMQI